MAKSFESFKKQLSAQYYYMNDAWLKDCLKYFLSAQPNANEADILPLIIHQWLLSDLREINNERGYLPKNIKEQKLIKLPGTYILQVEKAYDISTSKYKQLEKIRNISTENIEVTDVEKSQYPEPQSKRMLNLYLCDGIQEITAMEYKPIPSIQLNKIVPGFKIMIKGPVDCRRGVILLEEKNISLIGGEIESILIKNATENLLARALNLPENPNPYKNLGDDDDLSDMDIDLDAVENIEKLNDVKLSPPAINPSRSKLNQIPMTSIKKRNSIMINELPVCFEKEPQDINEVVDDADDEWIGMIDENDLNIVTAPASPQTRDSARALQQYESDLEFCEFEMDDLTEYSSTSCQNKNTPIPQNVTNTSGAQSKIISNKPIIQSPPAASTHRTNNMTTPKIHAPKTSPVNIRQSPANLSKISSKQQAVRSEAMNTKITDFMRKTDSPKNTRSPSSNNNYDSICDVKRIMPVKEVTYKTIKATTKTLQKLTKKDANWYLEGCVTDGIDCIDVIFSSEVLDRTIGFNFNEFSQRKKLQKTNPKIIDELRLTLRNVESVFIQMDALLKIELVPNEFKAKIISMT